MSWKETIIVLEKELFLFYSRVTTIGLDGVNFLLQHDVVKTSAQKSINQFLLLTSCKPGGGWALRPLPRGFLPGRKRKGSDLYTVLTVLRKCWTTSFITRDKCVRRTLSVHLSASGRHQEEMTGGKTRELVLVSYAVT